MLTFYLILTLFFALNMTADEIGEEKKEREITGRKVTGAMFIGKFIGNAIIWPLWLLRVLWKTIFTHE